MICPPCAKAADESTATVAHWQREHQVQLVPRHDPAICDDVNRQPHGCTCQHGQRGRIQITGLAK
jgi:hypothetical protein